MKNFTILLSILFIAGLTNAQDYNISFTASGEASSIDSIQVYNMSKEESITLSGDDILNLKPLGIEILDAEKYNISLYPNPANSSMLNFKSPEKKKIKISIFDTRGRYLAGKSDIANRGKNSYRISGLPTGIYMIRLNIDEKYHTSSLSICNSENNNPSIEKAGISSNIIQTKNTSTERETIIMDYDFQEYLRFTAYSGTIATVRVHKPMGNTSLNFIFHDCTDYDGNYYPAVQVGEQLWMGKNLKSQNDAGGNSISRECYNNESANCDTYGGLYLWNTIMNGGSTSDNNPSGVQGICPDGWHLPSDEEWKVLEMEMGMSEAAANSTGDRGLDEGSELAGNKNLWQSGILTDEDDFATSGFDALPGGLIDHNSGDYYLGQQAYFWTCTENDGSTGWIRIIKYQMSKSLRTSNNKANALSVRCVKD